jgi:hypothetical protein
MRLGPLVAREQSRNLLASGPPGFSRTSKQPVNDLVVVDRDGQNKDSVSLSHGEVVIMDSGLVVSTGQPDVRRGRYVVERSVRAVAK